MIGIYEDSFIDYLRDNLGCEPKITNSNIITRCPVCLDKHIHEGKDHKHLYISLDSPIFNCFQAGCPAKGLINKLIKSIEGKDISDKFINKDEFKKFEKIKNTEIRTKKKNQVLKIPELFPSMYSAKSFYLKSRLKFANVCLHNIPGLVFNCNEFFNINNIVESSSLSKIKEYLHTNFIGFVTKNQSSIIFRNIDENSTFRYYKYKINNVPFLDYYRLENIESMNYKTIVIAEGIFDIFCEYLYDSTDLKNETRVYASALSNKFHSLIKSIIFDEQLFRPDVKILSDHGVPLSYYEKLKKYNGHIINSLTVYYNKLGKDFGNIKIPTKIII